MIVNKYIHELQNKSYNFYEDTIFILNLSMNLSRIQKMKSAMNSDSIGNY